MKNIMKPLPVRFNEDVMKRCKEASETAVKLGVAMVGLGNASEVARKAMEIGINKINKSLLIDEEPEGDSHLQEDLLK